MTAPPWYWSDEIAALQARGWSPGAARRDAPRSLRVLPFRLDESVHELAPDLTVSERATVARFAGWPSALDDRARVPLDWPS